MPEYVINEYNPLLDSSDMDPSDWYSSFVLLSKF
jgi:hypothetical protein